jgi:hypothetical protein
MPSTFQLALLLCVGASFYGCAYGAIDREALVMRHTPHMTCRTSLACAPSFQTLGNGEFAFTADVTGLQTFNASAPLSTMAHWGWHTTPVHKSSSPGATPSNFRYQQITVHGKSVPYPTGCVEGEDTCGTAGGSNGTSKHEYAYGDRGGTEQAQTTSWLRANPHRLVLGRLYLRARTLDLASLSNINQTLNMWCGVLDSRFTLGGHDVRVISAVHPKLDMVAVRVESVLLSTGELSLGLDFPYGNEGLFSHGAAWGRDGDHSTTVTDEAQTATPATAAVAATLLRSLDAESYIVRVNLSTMATGKNTPTNASPPAITRRGPNAFVMSTGSGMSTLTAAVGYSNTAEPNATNASSPHPLPSFEETLTECAAAWQNFWRSGAAVDFTGSADHRAAQLENRVVMSQWVSRTQEAGSLPPAETGLVANSWYGKFHGEMR